jgi:uncharacterized membrane protein YqiK
LIKKAQEALTTARDKAAEAAEVIKEKAKADAAAAKAKADALAATAAAIKQPSPTGLAAALKAVVESVKEVSAEGGDASDKMTAAVETALSHLAVAPSKDAATPSSGASSSNSSTVTAGGKPAAGSIVNPVDLQEAFGLSGNSNSGLSILGDIMSEMLLGSGFGKSLYEQINGYASEDY